MDPLVSVIIPNYNHATFLKQRIDSVLHQTFQHFEIIILDDCSVDGSRDIIELYKTNPKVSKIIYNDINSGSPFKQWQKGIELAVGKYIWIAESDDYCENSFLEKAVNTLNNNNHAVHFCQSYIVDEHGNLIDTNFSWTEDIPAIDWHKPFVMNGKEFIKKALQFKNVIPNASAVVFLKSKIDFKQLQHYKTAGDWLFWIRMLLPSKVSYSEEVLNNFRSHGNTTRNARNATTHRKYILRHYEILAIKYKVFKDYNLVDVLEWKRFLKVCIDISSIADLPFFVVFCYRFKLPYWFMFYFMIRKPLNNKYVRLVER